MTKIKWHMFDYCYLIFVLKDIYLKHCKSRAVKIIEDSNHPDNRLLFTSSSEHQAPKLIH